MYGRLGAWENRLWESECMGEWSWESECMGEWTWESERMGEWTWESERVGEWAWEFWCMGEWFLYYAPGMGKGHPLLVFFYILTHR